LQQQQPQADIQVYWHDTMHVSTTAGRVAPWPQG
jgi:hypothetical protein